MPILLIELRNVNQYHVFLLYRGSCSFPTFLGRACPKRQLGAYSAAPAGLFYFIILPPSLFFFFFYH